MNTNTILQEYDNKCALYAQFISAMEALLVDLLKQYQIRVHSVTSRLKGRRSLENKLAREGRDYDKLNDVTDICGLRVITYYPDQVDSISSLILNEFDVDPKHSVDKRAAIAPDRFGYLSVHYVVKLPVARLQLTEYRRFSDCKAEVQVRSILQHAWAEIEHDLGYKTQNAVPRQIRRRFYRLAGLLELADDEFIRIRDELSDYETNIAQMIINSPNKVRLDQASLLVYLKSSQLVHKVNGEIERATHTILVKSDFLQDTLRRLRYLGFKTIADIDTALTTHKKQIVHFAKRLIAPAGVGVEEGYYPADVCLFYLCYAVLSSEGSIDKIRSFYRRLLGKETDEDFCQFILNG